MLMPDQEKLVWNGGYGGGLERRLWDPPKLPSRLMHSRSEACTIEITNLDGHNTVLNDLHLVNSRKRKFCNYMHTLKGRRDSDY